MSARALHVLGWIAVLAFALLWLGATLVFGAPLWLTAPAAFLTGVLIAHEVNVATRSREP